MLYDEGMFRIGWGRISKVMAISMCMAIVVVATLATTALADDVVQLRWDFEEGSGTSTSDSSGNNNQGTLFNGATYVTGNNGLAVSLNGVNQYVQSNAPIASLGQDDTPYALSAWVRVPSGVTNGNIVHISSMQNGSGWCIPFLRLQGGVFRATGWDGNSVSAIGTTAIVADQWYQVLTSWDSVNGLRLFVNGVLEDSSPQSTYDAYNSPVYASVGQSNSACSEDQGFLRGTVDDMRIYDRALNAADIVSINNPTSIADDPQSGVAGNDSAVNNTATNGLTVPGAPNAGVSPSNSTVTPHVLTGLIVGVGVVIVSTARRLKR